MAESHLKIATQRIKKDRLAVAGFVVICLFALVALLDVVPVPYRDAGGLHFSRTALDVIAKKPVELSYSPPMVRTAECSTARNSP